MKKYIYIIILIITIYGCCYRIEKIVANQDKISSICKDKMFGRRGNSFYLFTYKNKIENMYLFELIDSVKPYKIVFDTCYIEFSPDSVIGILYDSTYQCKQQLCEYISNMKKELNSLYIEQFCPIWSSNPLDSGLNLYLTNGDRLEYMPKRTGEIEEYKKVGEGWYLYDD
jgi:hypothetical protein